MRFKVQVRRIETYIAEITIDGESAEQVKSEIQAKFNTEGWDSVVSGDGEYNDCYSEVEVVKAVPSGWDEVDTGTD